MDGRRSQVVFVERLAQGFEPPTADGETVVLTIALAGEPPAGCLLESVREFCRKRGIRFEPGPWRYKGGLV